MTTFITALGDTHPCDATACTALSRGSSCPPISVTSKLSICNVRDGFFAWGGRIWSDTQPLPKRLVCRASLPSSMPAGCAVWSCRETWQPCANSLHAAPPYRRPIRHAPSASWKRPRGRPRDSWLKPFLHSNIPINERWDAAVRRGPCVSVQRPSRLWWWWWWNINGLVFWLWFRLSVFCWKLFIHLKVKV